MRIADAEEEEEEERRSNGNDSNGKEYMTPRERLTEEIKEGKWRRKPQPKFWRDVIVGASEELEEENRTNEISKVEFLKVLAPPFTEVKVERTVGGDKQVIVEQAPLWRFDSNRIDLQERGTPLVVGQNQSLIITLVNPRSDAGNIHVSVHLEKDQLLPRRRY